MNKGILGDRKLDTILQRPLLGLQDQNVLHHLTLEALHILLLACRELFDELLERLASFGLCRPGTSSEELGDAVLQDLVDEVLVAKRLFLLRVLSDHAHDLAQTVRIIDGHLEPSQGLSFRK